MLRIARALAATAVLIATEIPGQPRPDFSGTWKAAPNADSVAGAAVATAPGSGWGPLIVLAQNATTLTVEYTPYAPRDAQPPIRLVYQLNGAASRNVLNVGRGDQEWLSTASWSGAALVITTTYPYTNPETGEPTRGEVKHTLSLEDATTLIVETDRAAALGGPSSTTRTRYTKS